MPYFTNRVSAFFSAKSEVIAPPPKSALAKPPYINEVAMVATKEGTPRKTCALPLIAPSAIPTRTATTGANHGLI